MTAASTSSAVAVTLAAALAGLDQSKDVAHG